MTVVHIVLFKLKSTVTDAEIRELCEDFLSLQAKCIHPTTNQQYILSMSGGKDHSPENLQQGFTHGFVEEFATIEDRNYYLNEDVNHLAFVKKHGPQIEKVGVVDYSKGVY